jgi:hypothetical protein
MASKTPRLVVRNLAPAALISTSVRLVQTIAERMLAAPTPCLDLSARAMLVTARTMVPATTYLLAEMLTSALIPTFVHPMPPAPIPTEVSTVVHARKALSGMGQRAI